MPLRLVTPPAFEPITLDDAKAHCRVDNDAQDLLLGSLIVAARACIEELTARKMAVQTWELLLDAFPWRDDVAIRLPLAPVREVVSITYIDEAGAEQTWEAAQYVVDSDTAPGRIFPAHDFCYPSTEERPNAVTVRFTVGYQDDIDSPSPPPEEDVPEPLRQAMLLKVQELYDGKLLTNTIESLCAPYKLWGF